MIPAPHSNCSFLKNFGGQTCIRSFVSICNFESGWDSDVHLITLSGRNRKWQFFLFHIQSLFEAHDGGHTWMQRDSHPIRPWKSYRREKMQGDPPKNTHRHTQHHPGFLVTTHTLTRLSLFLCVSCVVLTNTFNLFALSNWLSATTNDYKVWKAWCIVFRRRRRLSSKSILAAYLPKSWVCVSQNIILKCWKLQRNGCHVAVGYFSFWEQL